MSDLTDQGRLPTAQKAARRLSFPRLVLAVATAGVLVGGGLVGHQWLTSPSRAGSAQTWFASYVDVTANPRYATTMRFLSTVRESGGPAARCPSVKVPPHSASHRPLFSG